jgi:sugar phosphate permease
LDRAHDVTPAAPAGMRDFLRANAPWLAAGGSMTFASSIGQTFFIGLYAGEIRAEFGLTHGAWGAIYTVGTLAAAAVMLFAGGVTDRVAPRRLATIVLCLLAGVALGMALVPVWWLLPVLIFGLRFCGQGMMSHVAIVAVGRWFRASRGKAVSVVGTGHSLGEALLPLPFVLLIGWAGWRAGWVAAALLALLFVPLVGRLLARDRVPAGQVAGEGQAGIGGRHWDRRAMLRHWLFWAVFPAFLAQPVFGTALFFQQVHLAEVKGWPLEGFVALYPMFVAPSLVALFAAGAAIDRFGTGRVVPFVLLPMAAGFTVFALGSGLGSAAAGFVLVGLSQGGSAAVAGAFWPEHFGTRHLGSIRAVASAAMVFATAISPGLTGVLIDAGIGIEVQFLGFAAYAVGMALLLGLAMARVRRGEPAALRP